MPIYEFRCLECGQLFEKLFLNPNEKIEQIECPACKSASSQRVISRANYTIGKSGKKPTLTTKSCSPGTNCVTLDVPGPD